MSSRGSRTYGSGPSPASAGPPGFLLPVLLAGVLLAVVGGKVLRWIPAGGGRQSPEPTTPLSPAPSPGPSSSSTSFPSYGESPSAGVSGYPLTTTTTSTTLPGPAASPTPTINETLDAEAERIWNRLTIGSIAYNPEERMLQGVPKDVVARIAADPNAEGLTKGFPASPRIEALKVSGVMQAELKEGETGTFEINKTSDTNEQAILPPYSEWKWIVTPLQTGVHSLHLSVSVIMELPDKRTRKKVLTKEASIRVIVNPRYVARTFFENNWQWVLGSPIVLGAVAWVWAHLRRKKKKGPAGFRPDDPTP
jgi:hypothetical protein